MSAPGTTPGPWAYRPDEFDDWGIVRGAPDELGRRWIICQARSPFCGEAKLAEHRRLGTDPWEADAHLIAAAPELYEALLAEEEADAARSNCTECEGQGDWTHCAECSPRFGKAICLRRAALAKASPSARSSECGK